MSKKRGEKIKKEAKRTKRGGGKRGQVQVDWAMSLSIFLLYITWFFLFIRPSFMPAQDINAMFSSAEEGFKENISWSIELLPVFVKSNVTSIDEPVVADFSYNWLTNNTGFKDRRYFVIDEDKLFFLGNLTNRSIFWVAHSEENYILNPVTKNLYANEVFASVNKHGFKTDFKDGLPSAIAYNDKQRMSSFKIELNDKEIDAGKVTNTTFNLTSILAKYKMESSSINHSSYVFAESTRIYGYIAVSQNTPEQNTVTLAMELTNYTNYYSDAKHSGAVTALDDCEKYTSDYIDFYDASGGLTIITETDANLSLCYDTHIDAEITMTFNNKTNYKIILHQGNYEDTLQYVNYMTTKTGAIDNTTGLSSSKINATNETGYAALKNQWGYADNNDFNFLVLNASGSVVYDYSPIIAPATADVYVKEWNDYILDKYGTKTLYKVRVKVW